MIGGDLEVNQRRRMVGGTSDNQEYKSNTGIVVV
jgi:hypothetical protein